MFEIIFDVTDMERNTYTNEIPMLFISSSEICYFSAQFLHFAYLSSDSFTSAIIERQLLTQNLKENISKNWSISLRVSFHTD
jgi:hypothetical protein